MITIYHTFEIAGRRFTYCTKINMYTHKNGNQKSCDKMEQVGKVKTAADHNAIYVDIREDQAQA